VAANNLRSRNAIRAGQVLVLPEGGFEVAALAPVQPAAPPALVDEPEEPATPPAGGIYSVHRGDTLWSIARRFGTTERELVRANGLDNRHRITVGQNLRVPGGEIVVASVDDALPAPAAAASEAEPPPPEPVADATVAVTRILGQTTVASSAPAPAPADEPEPEPAPVATTAPVTPPPEAVVLPLTPEPEPELEEADPTGSALAIQASEEVEDAADAPLPETAAVLPNEPGIAPEVRSDPSDYEVHPDGRITVQAAETLGHYAEWLEVGASKLRARNKLRSNSALVIGRRIHLDFSRVSQEEFERRRLEYHRTLQSEFFDHFTVTGTEQHVLARGESLWYLAERKYRVPVWLLRQYNPDLDFGALKTGTAMLVPVIEPRAEGVPQG
jgi:membrane-bound lytic murein transglycosylase D